MTTKGNWRSTISRRQFLRGAAASALGLAAAPLAAVGCSAPPAPAATQAPSKAPPVPAAAAPTAAQAASTAAPAVVKANQDIVMGIGTDVTVMDGRMVQVDTARSQIEHVLEPLMWPDDTGKPVPILSSAWEPVANPTGWRFKLRPGIKFTNGEPFNAQSLKYSLESVVDDANKSWISPGTRSALASIKEIRAEDEQTVLIVTDGFWRALPTQLYQYQMLPPKYAADKGKEFGINPIGTGHYKFVEYRSQDHLRLEVNPDYHGNWDGPANNRSVTFRYLSENATRVAALEAGEVHLIDNLPPDAISRIKNNSNLDVLVSPTNRIMGMFMHCGRPPFNNLKARLAVAHAIDRDSIAKKIMGGMVDVAQGPFPPGTIGTAGETFQPYTFDVNKAKQYFADAGLTTGTPIKFGSSVGRYVNDKQIATAVAGMLSDVGFDPQIEQTEFGVFWPKVNQEAYDIWYMGWVTVAFDTEDFRTVYTASGADNAGIVHFVEQNKQVLDLYDKGNKTTDMKEAEGYFKQLAHLLWDNQPVAYMHYEPNLVGVSKKLQGWKPRRDQYIYLWGATLA